MWSNYLPPVSYCATLLAHCSPANISITFNTLTEKAMAPHSSTLAWKIPGTEEPGRLQSWAASLSLFIFMHWRRKWQPTPLFLPGESQGQEPGGLPSVGSHRVGHDWHDLAVAEFLLCAFSVRPPPHDTRDSNYILLFLLGGIILSAFLNNTVLLILEL